MYQNRLSTGITGLDEVLHGGFIPGQAYLVRGGPGSGKTTLGFHFLVTGSANGEKSMYISLGESETQLRRNGSALNFDLKEVAFLDLSPTSESFTQVQIYDIFSPAEVERDPITRKIIEHVEALQPQRVFVDSMTQFRYLATDAFQFRKQVVSFLRFLKEQGATVIFASEGSPEAPDEDLQFLSDGIIHMGVSNHERTLTVSKFRGSGFRKGDHAMRLTADGIKLFPKLIPEKHRKEFVVQSIPSGVPELDEMLHGGFERGSVSVISGPSGVGKTTLGMQFMKEAAGRGERSVAYIFEEDKETLLSRCEAINIPARTMLERGTLALYQIEPLLYTPDEFANLVRQEVEEQKACIVMLDSISGYRLSIRGQDLVRQLHALCQYLRNMGVTALILNEVETITGDFRVTEVGISYVADTIVFLRYLEIQGQLRKAIGVLKKRLSNFEKTLREIEVSRYGIKVGKPLDNLRGILSGTPEFLDD